MSEDEAISVASQNHSREVMRVWRREILTQFCVRIVGVLKQLKWNRVGLVLVRVGDEMSNRFKNPLLRFMMFGRLQELAQFHAGHLQLSVGIPLRMSTRGYTLCLSICFQAIGRVPLVQDP